VAKRRGRQAEAARNDLRVLAAARQVFAARGADAPVSAIAECAGVGMGSLYRRYGSKQDLLRQLCLLAMRQSIEAADRALLEADAWQGLTGYVIAAVDQSTGALAPLAGAVETTPEMWECSRHGRDRLERLTALAHDQGTLRADVTALDIAWLIELFGRLGPVRPGTHEHNIRQRLLTVAIDGLRAGNPNPLPGTPPSAAHYEGRWAVNSP
jgi:AcrR family transcriptional regulator